jgi:hypothetical protein
MIPCLRSVKNNLPLKPLKSFYYTLFHGHLIYAIEILSWAVSSTTSPLITKQKASIHLLSNKWYMYTMTTMNQGL